jgi:hypothetical protein
MNSINTNPFYQTYKSEIHLGVGVILAMIGIGLTLLIALIGAIITTYSYIESKKRLQAIELDVKKIHQCSCRTIKN